MKVTGVMIVSFLLTLQASAQQSLPDVAYRVVLNTPGGGPVVIDDANLGRTPPEPVEPSYRKELVETRELVLGAIAEIESVIGEVSSGSVLYSSEWRSTAVHAAYDLEHTAALVTSAIPPPGQEESFAAASAASDELRSAGELLRETVATRSGALGAHNVHVREGRRLLDEAILLAERRERAQALMEPPAELQSHETVGKVREMCASRWPDSPAQRRECERSQRTAVLALEARIPFSTGLAEPGFNRMRNSCLTQ